MPALASALRWLTGGLPRPALQPPFGDGNQFNPFAPFGGAGGAVPSGLEAGSTRRRMAYWQPASAHVNSLMRSAGPNVVARARWLVRNNGYAKAALRAWSAATVGARHQAIGTDHLDTGCATPFKSPGRSGPTRPTPKT